MHVTALDRGYALLQIFAAFVGLAVLAALFGFVAPAVPDWLRLPVQNLGFWGAVITGGLLLRQTGSSYRAIGFRKPESWGRTWLWTGAAILISLLGAQLIGTAINSFTDWPPLDTSYIRSQIEGNTAAWLAWILLVVWGTAAFGEELLMRGFVMDRLQVLFAGRAAIVLAIIGQALIFGLMHAVQGPTGIVLTAYVGLVFAIIYFASGRNLWPVILAHGILDTVSLTLMYLRMPLSGYID